MIRGYEREEQYPEMEDGYSDYEDDDDGYGQEEEEYEEEEEDPRPTKEALEYLELRQRLKEQIRKKNKKGSGSALNNSNDRKRKLPYDNYGSFFGPSQPVISQRVIEESKSFLETQHLTPKVSNPTHQIKKGTSSSTPGSKHKVLDKKTRVVNEVRSKVQKLKQTRDYSFLLSDDAKLPEPSKAVPQRNTNTPSSDARPAQVPLKNKQGSVTTNGRHVNGHVERKPVPSMNGQRNSRPELNKLPSTSRPNSNSMSVDSSRRSHSGSNGTGPGRPSVDSSRRSHSGSNGTGPGRPVGPKGAPTKSPGSVQKKVSSSSVARNSVSNMQRPLSSKSQPPSRPQTSSSKNQLPSKSQPISKLQNSSKLQSSVSRHPMEQRRELQGPAKTKVLPKQSAGLSRPQINNKPLKRISSHQRSPDNRPKKKPMRRYSDDEDDEGEAAISMIRKMFGYNPNKFANRDDDLSDMEANFDDIMREEKRSAKIARREDEEQLRLIEEEERREQLAKVKKQKRP